MLSLWKVKQDGTRLQQIYEPVTKNVFEPIICSNQKYIYYYTYRGKAGSGSTIESYDTETGEHTTILNLGTERLDPFGLLCSPNGDQILYQYQDAIWLINLDGNKNRKFVSLKRPMEAVSWSPSGNSIALIDFQFYAPGSQVISILNYRTKKIHYTPIRMTQFIDWLP